MPVMVPELAGRKRNYPVVRQGTLALIDIDKEGPGQGVYYFAEATSYAGNSGAPVFVSLQGLRRNTMRIRGGINLLGVNKGHLSQVHPSGGLESIGLQRFTRVELLLELLCEEVRPAKASLDTSKCSDIEAPP